MVNTYLDIFDVLSVCFENSYQKIFICKHKETDNYYLLNSIMDKSVVSDIGFHDLKDNVKSIIDIIDTEESINILTEHRVNNTLIDFISSNKITLSKQVNLTSYIMDKLLEFKNQPNKVFTSFFNHCNFEVDTNDNIYSTGVLLLSPNYINISIEEVLRTIANTMSIIFSGKQIEGNVIPKEIPPDISKLISNCLENKYIRLIDLVSDYKSTNLYRLINPEKQESSKVHDMRKNLSRKRFKYKLKNKALILLILILPIMVFAIDKIIDISHEESNNSMVIEGINTIKEKDVFSNNDNEDKDNFHDITSGNNQDSDAVVPNNSTEDIFNFFTEDMEFENEDNLGVIDSSKYHRGTSSIKVSNKTSENQTFLIGYIDLNDDKFSFYKDRILNVSLWVNSSDGKEANITLKLETNEKILYYTSEKLDTVPNNWIMQNIEFNSKNAEHLKIYITVSPNEELWIDTIEVDILK